MHLNNHSGFKTSYPMSSQEWDPEKVLGFTYTTKCIGWAASRNRRCERDVAGHKRKCGQGILNTLACDSASKAAESPKLSRAADIMLCWQHANQLPGIVKRWESNLENWAAEYEDDGLSSDSEPEVDSWSSDEFHVKQEEAVGILAEELRKMMKRMQQNLDSESRRRMAQIYQDDLMREAIRQAEEHQAREEKRKQEEAKRKEEEQKQKEEEERKRKEEERKRAEKAREEAFRERIRIAREKREREAQERAEKEATEWRAAWEWYSNAWNKRPGDLILSIPWPVKSRLQSDVNEANIKLFFAKAPPKELIDSGEKRFRFINAENKRWHTDKVIQRFGRDVVNGAAKDTLGVIAKAVIELRQAAQRERTPEGE